MMREPTNQYNLDAFCEQARPLLDAIAGTSPLDAARKRLFARATELQLRACSNEQDGAAELSYVHDCLRVFRGMLEPRSESVSGFSVAQALYDIAQERPRTDLSAGFFADLSHIVGGLLGNVPPRLADDLDINPALQGRQAAICRSDELDRLSARAFQFMEQYPCGLDDEAIARRQHRRDFIMRSLRISADDWDNPWWHIQHVLRDVEQISRCVTLTDEEIHAIELSRRRRLPFGITPFYASLMDDEPHVRDRAIRAQVFPPISYVNEMSRSDAGWACSHDFMLERDTSPVDLITRRYPGIVIIKPFNTCPQICVYCQRNWEITDAMMQGALAPDEKINNALAWIANHPAIHDVLVTGGEPLALDDDYLIGMLNRLAEISSVKRLRIGTRIPVTVPMRLSSKLLDRVAALRVPGKREVCFVTHIQHAYELNHDMLLAIERIRRRGINVYNQNVYTFYISRRFEATMLRHKLRLLGVDPYYTFNTKGKAETIDYRVPIARLLQEQHEETRLMPGMERTDEAVFNVPRLGKNYLRARQHRDLLTITPDGSRVYEWHPWEKNISTQASYLVSDVPILEYLNRLERIGEDISHYASIWYYY